MLQPLNAENARSIPRNPSQPPIREETHSFPILVDLAIAPDVLLVAQSTAPTALPLDMRREMRVLVQVVDLAV